MQRTLGDEIKWARQAEAAINARATAIHGEAQSADVADTAAEEVVQRVRIPAAGVEYRLLPQAIQRMPGNTGGGLVETLFLLLAVEDYGEGVCELDQLEPGARLYLEEGSQTLSFQVRGDGARWRSESSPERRPLVVAVFPCGERGERLFISATPVSD